MKWWRGKNASQTHRQWKKQKAEITHACLICEKYHPRVRLSHGILLDDYRRFNTVEDAMKGYRWSKETSLKRLLDFERNIEQYDKRAKEFDQRMASWRGK